MKKNELWYFLIAGEIDAENGTLANFYAYGDHLGDALDKIMMAPFDFDFNNLNPLEASLLDSFDVIGKGNELFEIAEDVYIQPTLITFPLNKQKKMFFSPVGIVASIPEDQYENKLMKENFVVLSADENGVYEFELVLEKENLIDTFIKTIEFLPTVDGCWIYIKNYWENELTELWVAKHFEDKQTVIDFLQQQKKNTLENGYLDIVIHSLKGETNLMLDDHKKIQLYSKDKEIFDNFIGNIIDLGYQQTKDLYNFESGCHHFHYRPADSLTRTEFKQMLKDHNFEQIDKWEE